MQLTAIDYSAIDNVIWTLQNFQKVSSLSIKIHKVRMNRWNEVEIHMVYVVQVCYISTSAIFKKHDKKYPIHTAP